MRPGVGGGERTRTHPGGGPRFTSSHSTSSAARNYGTMHIHSRRSLQLSRVVEGGRASSLTPAYAGPVSTTRLSLLSASSGGAPSRAWWRHRSGHRMCPSRIPHVRVRSRQSYLLDGRRAWCNQERTGTTLWAGRRSVGVFVVYREVSIFFFCRATPALAGWGLEGAVDVRWPLAGFTGNTWG